LTSETSSYTVIKRTEVYMVTGILALYKLSNEVDSRSNFLYTAKH